VFFLNEAGALCDILVLSPARAKQQLREKAARKMFLLRKLTCGEAFDLRKFKIYHQGANFS
jgi:hypothetical protein